MGINALTLAASVLGLVSALVTLYVAWRIPHQIMIHQRYAELLTEYRSIEMGDAIFSIFDFFVNDCKDRKGKTDQEIQKIIEEKYRERYKKEIEIPQEEYRKKVYSEKDNPAHCFDPKKTLHFKRRLVDYFFWLLADLRFNPNYVVKIPKNQLKRDFSGNEYDLLNITYRMNKASEKIQLKTGNIDKLPESFFDQDDSPMAQLRKKLYNEAKHW